MSFHRAAERLNMCQPPLGRQIRLLETEIGARLFERGRGSRVSLTDAGKIFLADAKKMLAAPEMARQRAREASNGTHGQLVLAFQSTITISVLGRCLRAFRQRHSKVSFLDLNASAHPAALRAGRIDAGLTLSFDPEKKDNLEFLHLLDLQLVVVFPPEHRFAEGKGEIEIHELAEEVILCPHADNFSCYAVCLEELFAKASFAPREVRHVDGMDNLVSMAIGGYGVAILPKLAHAELDPAMVRARPSKELHKPLQLGLCTLP